MDIKKVITAKGWTTVSLAKAMGVKQPSLSRMINGNPTLDNLKKMADAMGISVSELVSDGDTPATIICPHCGKPIKINVCQ